MNHSHYNDAKEALIYFSKEVKKTLKSDRPGIRQSINDYCDLLLKSMPSSISDKQKDLYISWLSSKAADLHPR